MWLRKKDDAQYDYDAACHEIGECSDGVGQPGGQQPQDQTDGKAPERCSGNEGSREYAHPASAMVSGHKRSEHQPGVSARINPVYQAEEHAGLQRDKK